uniref:chemerin-like receptor 1 n=1 Tax=Pristiophorus japonicus TaxID=55135 RepID=UPI00398F14CF
MMRSYSIVIYVVTCVLGMLGNGLVIWATGFKLKRTAYTVWLLSLAVADFTVSLLLPLTITEFALYFRWPFGWLLCKLRFGAVALCLYASIFTLVAISVDRCVSVMLPIWSRTHHGPRLAALLSLGVWMAAAIFSAPSFVFQQIVPQGNWTRCSTEYLVESEREALAAASSGDEDYEAVREQAASLRYARYRAMTLTCFLGGFLLPFLIIAASYAIIGLQLRYGRLVPSGRKPFKVIVTVVLAFLLCWAPYHIISILRLLYAREEWSPALIVVIALSYSLAYINSCVNPVLYIFMWQDFRDLLKKSLQRVNNQGESALTNLSQVWRDLRRFFT